MEPEVKANNVKLPPTPFKEDSERKPKKNSERKRSSSKNKLDDKKEETIQSELSAKPYSSIL